MIRLGLLLSALALSGCCIPVAGDGEMDFSILEATDDDRVDAVQRPEPEEHDQDEEHDPEDYEGYEREFEEWKAKRE